MKMRYENEYVSLKNVFCFLVYYKTIRLLPDTSHLLSNLLFFFFLLSNLLQLFG